MTTIPDCTLTDGALEIKAREWIKDLCKTKGRSWRLSIPVEVNHDPDMIFAELCNRMTTYATKLREAEQEIAYLNSRLNGRV